MDPALIGGALVLGSLVAVGVLCGAAFAAGVRVGSAPVEVLRRDLEAGRDLLEELAAQLRAEASGGASLAADRAAADLAGGSASDRIAGLLSLPTEAGGDPQALPPGRETA